MELTKDEHRMFLAICKYVRWSQEMGIIKRMTDGIKLNAPEIRGTFFDLQKAVEGSNKNYSKKAHAVAYSLQEKGFVKISKRYAYKGRYINIDTKGVEYIDYLKERIK